VNLRATLLLALVALALAVYVYSFERGPSGEEKAELAGKLVLEADREAVRGLELPIEDGSTAKLTRDAGAGGSWRLEEPIAFPADEGSVEGILSALEKLEAESVIEDRPDDLEPFGLGGDARRLRIDLDEGDSLELAIGAATPVGAHRYVARSDVPERLYAVAQWKIDSLVPSLMKLRDKRITRLESEDVTSIRVSHGGDLVVSAARVASEGDGDTWEIQEPFQARADGQRIQRLIQDFVFGRASDFVDEAGGLDAYGLASPQIVLVLAADEAQERIELGSVDDKLYARVAQSGLVLELPKRLLEAVPTELFGYRYKQVLALSGDEVERMELRFPRDDATYAFAREEARWVSEDPETRVESLKLDDLIWALRDLEAIGLVEASVDPTQLGLDTPRVRVILEGAGGAELAELELGNPQFPDGLAARSSQGESIWRVDNDLGRDVPLGLEAFRNRWIEGEEAVSEAAEETED
jgi:hypothetical protein